MVRFSLFSDFIVYEVACIRLRCAFTQILTLTQRLIVNDANLRLLFLMPFNNSLIV